LALVLAHGSPRTKLLYRFRPLSRREEAAPMSVGRTMCGLQSGGFGALGLGRPDDRRTVP